MEKFKKLDSKNPIFTKNKNRETENKLQQNMKTKYEKIPTFVFDESYEASLKIAEEIATKIKECQQKNRPCVLGLPIGSTPKQVYKELISMHKQEGLSFKNVITFNLDEYYPMKKDSLLSAYHYMHENLFQYVDIPPENIHIPDAELPIDKIYQHCQNYENLIKETGGIDILLLGIGRTGHIGFNEPGSQVNSRSRIIVVDTKTKQDAAPEFGGLEKVPMKAITIGIETIMKAKKVMLIAFGESKSHIIKKTVERP
ncbi:MAG: 6-phosphogluconolactonase, partial [Prolixibacteraceae bacterium]|nr:6-phosphogluconolactonase [Prolixibacteraceae bacterium]